MDALNLTTLTKNNIVFNLFEELYYNLEKFPGLDELMYQVKKLHQSALNHKDSIMSDNKLKEKLIDDLYQIFKEFQNKLNLKTK